MLRGKKKYIDAAEFEADLIQQRDWLASQLTNKSLPTDLFQTFQQAGHTVESKLFSEF
jgi:hypothetical protein